MELRSSSATVAVHCDHDLGCWHGEKFDRTDRRADELALRRGCLGRRDARRTLWRRTGAFRCHSLALSERARGVVLSMMENPAVGRLLMQEGQCCIFSKTDPITNLTIAVHAAYANGRYLSPRMAAI
ncbi:hypothetical protein [Paraburkholderia atlantica]|uniref:hypothetical protein n=1 Tax=Paraburkholderia atlantica TaxID=2654982 RepID=UPI001EE6571E|nr:hypothetical protein [Paraburkholderia atlantica]